jgi:hypothetical protein
MITLIKGFSVMLLSWHNEIFFFEFHEHNWYVICGIKI